MQPSKKTLNNFNNKKYILKPSFQNWTIFPIPEAADAGSRIRGGNAKSLLLIYTIEQETADTLEAFLKKVIHSVGFDLTQDAATLILSPGEKLSLSQLRQQVPFDRVITFGPTPAQVGLNFIGPAYTPVDLSGRQYLFADSLESIYRERQQGGKQKAGKLWKAMKSMFDN